jgi:hypothetical protein
VAGSSTQVFVVDPVIPVTRMEFGKTHLRSSGADGADGVMYRQKWPLNWDNTPQNKL